MGLSQEFFVSRKKNQGDQSDRMNIATVTTCGTSVEIPRSARTVVRHTVCGARNDMKNEGLE